jgi:hypothetical protein
MTLNLRVQAPCPNLANVAVLTWLLDLLMQMAGVVHGLYLLGEHPNPRQLKTHMWRRMSSAVESRNSLLCLSYWFENGDMLVTITKILC